MRQAKRKFDKDIGNNSKTNPKAFWSRVRKRLKTKSSVALLLKDTDDKESTKFEDEKKANILQKQFSSIFTWEPEGEIPKLAIRTDTFIYNLLVTEEMVRTKSLTWMYIKLVGLMKLIHRF